MARAKRQFLTSVRPDIRNGAPVVLALCEACGTVQAFHHTERCQFPDTGYWTECRACGEWRYFFRIVAGRVVNKGSRESYADIHDRAER